MKTVIITATPFRSYEAEAIRKLLEEGGAWRVHLRKPGCSERDMRMLIESIPSHLHNRLSLHDCHRLAPEYGCGIHINSRCGDTFASPCATPVSRSCHSLAELAAHIGEDYLFLSPVFDSISKQGYRSAFPTDRLKGMVDSRTIALGGVTPACFQTLRDIGFGGAAMLGYIWKDYSPKRINNIINELCSSS